MKRILRFFIDERGFGPHYYSFFYGVIFFGIVATILIPRISMKNMNLPPPACFVGMELLAEELDRFAFEDSEFEENEFTEVSPSSLFPDMRKRKLRCPLVKEAYTLLVKGNEWKLFCPDPDNHLGISPEGSYRTSEGWFHTSDGSEDGFQAWMWDITVDEHGTCSIIWNSNRPITYFIYGIIAFFMLIILLISFDEGVGSLAFLIVLFLILSGILVWLHFSDSYLHMSHDGALTVKSGFRSQHQIRGDHVITACMDERDVYIIVRNTEGGLSSFSIMVKKEEVAQKLVLMLNSRIRNGQKQSKD